MDKEISIKVGSLWLVGFLFTWGYANETIVTEYFWETIWGIVILWFLWPYILGLACR